MIGDRRGSGPPADSLAEAVVLTYLLHHPQRIAGVDLANLVVFPEHRLCWQAMARAFMRHGSYWPTFHAGFVEELERLAPGKSLNLQETMDCADLESVRAHEEALERPHHEDGMLRMSEYHHGFEWWLARLRRIAESRRLVHQAQQMAECAWREDVDGARATAERMAVSTATPVWERDEL